MADRNGIELLEEDHQELRMLLSRLEEAASHEEAEVADLCDELALSFRAHTTIEEELFYPAHREARSDYSSEVLFYEAMAEHRMAKMLIVELRETAPGTAQFEAGVRLLRTMIEHHLEEEEQTIFPSANDHMSSDELMQLGRTMAERRADIVASGEIHFEHAMPKPKRKSAGKDLRSNGQRRASARA